MLLVVLEHGRASSPLPIDHHVENGVQAAVTGEHPAQLPLGHGERMRRLAATVQNAWDQALPAQTARVGRTAPFALLDFQLDSLTSHDGGEV